MVHPLSGSHEGVLYVYRLICLSLAVVTWLCLTFLCFLTTFFGHRINADFEVWKQEAYKRGFNF